MEKEIIEKINSKCSHDLEAYEGILTEPYGIPVTIKEPVVYMRWNSGGYRGGSCWGDTPVYYQETKPKFKILEYILEEMWPDVSYLNYKKIESEIEKFTERDSDYENKYYGNSFEYQIEYIPLSLLENLIINLKN